MRFQLLIFSLTIISQALCQESPYTRNLDWEHERHAWSSYWITHPGESIVDYGVFLFRNEFSLEHVPDEFNVYVSADNRYRLFVNGQEVSFGPARGSLQYWRYETLDLAPFLREGSNLIAAEVFNLGPFRPVAQFSHVTAFIFQSEEFSDELNTGLGNWKVTKNKAYHARIVGAEMVLGKYYVAGPCDSIVASTFPYGWETNNFEMNGWSKPRIVQKGSGRGYMHGSPWMLIPRNIPMMEQKKVRFASIARQSANHFKIDRNGFHGEIPARTKVSILLDHKELSMGFPELFVSSGKGAEIRVTYSEALYNKEGGKGNRNVVEGKEIHGYSDVFVPDGGSLRLFRPLWLRTFRFIRLDIETGEDPLTVVDYYFQFTAYPFQENAAFSGGDNKLNEIWEVGWRTARLCALETYMDCPYWEQLQYIGDTRIQSLISLYVSGDDRLMRNALQTADRSRTPEGLTMGRGPTFVPQITPPFSLYWVDMVHDYFMHRNDPVFVKQFLPGVEAVLGWFIRRMDGNGMLGKLDWFNFSDWTPGFLCGSPAGVDDGNSALLSLNLVYALDRAAELFASFDDSPKADYYRSLSNSIRSSVYEHCFDSSRGILADTPFKADFSQHTNIFGILTDAFPSEQVQPVMTCVLEDSSLIQTTIYFKFYLFEALKKAGMADQYLEQLGPWYDMLEEGLSTFEEGDYDDRSDCHAWGSSPLYHFMSIVGGISPSKPGFSEINIAPAFGELKRLDIKLPHSEGELILSLKKNGSGVKGSVVLPVGIRGSFHWNKQEILLNEGENLIDIE